MRERILAPSILSADFTKLGEEIKRVEEAGAKYLHFDVMDGLFVPSISFGMPVLKSIRKASDIVYDVHLMIVEPERYVEYFKNSGADLITVHIETLKDPEAVLKQIKDLGAKVGLALNPETDVEKVYPYLHLIDMALVMTVHPGFGGQKYIHDCTAKIVALASKREELGLDYDIEVDGGIGEGTIDEAMDAGANILVAGSSVYGGDAYENAKKLMAKF
ncbi:MAG: ribulose-phosphate 3-epimerase [Lachnospiraceae bacterium]|nr:ribulose-phosphate 3-epimerase [Lachnospiraceae bacterium]